jgi:adenylate kinase
MNKCIILITGTPCTGKTVVAKQLTKKMGADYINLTELANTYNLIVGKDENRKTFVVDEEKMRQKLTEIIDATQKTTIVVDGHYAPTVVPKRYVTHVFVFRRNPVELRGFMQKRGFTDTKIWENLASEILDVCLVEALQEHEKEKVCEMDITGKTVEAVVNEILTFLNKNKKCSVGRVDWLGMLEKDGVVDEYLKI